VFGSRPVGIILAVLIGLLFGGSSLPSVANAENPVKLQKPLGEKCVINTDTEWVRRNHMDFLHDKRNLTVREGVRNPEESFLACKTCHVSREQFCDKCHTYVGVKPDCFDCHNYP